MTRVLLRCWGFEAAVLMAIAVGFFGLVFWREQPVLPMVRLPVPMPTLLPVLTGALLTWTLSERWPQQMATTVRNPALVPSARFLGTQATCIGAAVIASSPSASPAPVISLSSVSASLAALFAIMWGRQAIFALLICSYLWLDFAAEHPLNLATENPIWLAASAMVGCGALFVGAEARRRTPS